MSDTIAHEAYPFTHLARDYGFEPSIMFAYELGLIEDYHLGGQAVGWKPRAAQATKFKLSVHVKEYEGQTAFVTQYDEGLYSSSTIELFAETMAVALGNIMGEAQSPILSTSLVSPAQEATLRGFNRDDEKIPEQVLHRMFEKAATKFPERKALIAAEGEYTYARLNAQANRLAHALLERKVKAQDKVAFLLPHTGNILVAMLGILKAGCADIVNP